MNRSLYRSAAVAAAVGLVVAGCSSSSGGGSKASSSGGSSSSGSAAPASSGGPAAGGQKGGVLNMLGTGDVDYMDPNVSYYSIGYLGLRPWSRQLYTYPADPKKSTVSVPDLAAGPVQTSSDGKTVTVKLRPGIMWNTTPPRPVTAQDEVRGVQRTCNPVQPFGGIPDFADLIVGYQTFCDGFKKGAGAKPTPQSIAKYINSHSISGVQAKNSTTVVFKLTRPAGFFQDMLTLPAFSPAPKEYLNAMPGPDFGKSVKNLISDGPYYIASYSPTKSIDYKRNPAWKSSSDPVRKAYVDEIKVSETTSQQSAQQQLSTGTPSADIEWDDFPPPSKLPTLISSHDPNFFLGPTASSNPYVVFNFKSPNNGGALKKLPVRQAIEYAINRADILQVLGGPKVDPPLSHVLPPDIVGGEQNFDLYKNNPTKAKSMLSSAGVKGLTLKVLYRNASEGSTKTFETLQSDLSKVGIKVTGVPSPDADFYTKYLEVPSVASRGVWDLAIAGWGADWYGNGALSFFQPLFSGAPSYPPIGSNFGFYNSPKTNSLIKKAEAAQSDAQSKSLWHAADLQVMKDAAFFPITAPNQPLYHASQVHNAVYVPAIQGFDPTNVWLDPSKNGG